jgi:RNA polymerase sigma factor (sigma-70 family)
VKPSAEEFIPTRMSLLSRLKDWDDQESWREFFDTYWRLIHAVARRSGLSEEEAQDVVQDTVVSVAKNIHEFRQQPNGSFKKWLRNLTRWRIIDQVRKRSPAARSEGDPAMLEDIIDPASDRLDELWDREWESNLLGAAVERVKRVVSAEQFQMFDLHACRGWPARKVADALGVSLTHVYVAKHRVAALVRKEVKRLEKTAFQQKGTKETKR